MLLQWDNWKIKPERHGYCYVLQRKIGNKGRWIAESFHRDVQSAVIALLERRIMLETSDNIITANKGAETALSNAKLIAKINQIKDEILDVIGAVE